MKWRQTLRAGLGLLATLVAVAVAGLLWLYMTAGGARFVLERAITATDGALAVGEFTGSFSDELVLTDVRYRDSRAEVEIDRLSLRLGLAGLWSRMLVIEDLQSSIVRYRQLAGPTANDSLDTAPPSLPLTVRLSRASIEGVALTLEDRNLDFARITLSGIVDQTSAYLQRFEGRFMDFFVSLQGGLTWADGLMLDGLVSWSGELRDQQWLGSADVTGRWPRLEIEQEMLEPFAQTARGTLLLSAMPAFDLMVDAPGFGAASIAGGLDPASATWRAQIAATDLAPSTLLPGVPGLWSVNGNVSAGLTDGLRIASDDLQVAGRLGDEILQIDFSGAFSEPATLNLDRLVATLGANRAELSGTLSSSLDLRITAELADLAALATLAAREEVPALNPFADIAATLSGRASADIAVAGDPAAPQVNGALRLSESSYADLPLELAVDFATPAANEQVITIGRLDATLGSSRVTGRGSIGAAVLRLPRSDPAEIDLDLVLAATVTDLAELAVLADRDEVRRLTRLNTSLAGLGGQVEADATVQGSLNRIAINADLNGTEIVFRELRFAEASATGQIGLYEGGTANLTLAATAAPGTASLAADGRIAAGQWIGTLRSLELEERWLGVWSLTAPASFAIGQGQVDIANACLAHADSELCAEWRYGGPSDRLRIVADEFELAVLNLLLPSTVTLSGRLSLAANLDSPIGTPMGTLTASGQGIGIQFTMSETDQLTTTLESLTLNASLEGFALDLDAGVVSRAGGRANVTMATTDFRDSAAAISGRFSMAWPDLAALSLLSPDIGEVAGALAMSIDVAGTVADPILGGRAAIADGRVAIPEWGILIDRIEGEAMSPDGNSLEYRGTGYIEDSEIRVTGASEFDPAAGWPTRLKVVGDNVTIASRPDARILASPDLDVTIRLPRIDVSGRVLVPEADISVEQLPLQAVKVSPDSIVHGGAVNEPMRPLEMTADVSVELGDFVNYTGSNLDTNLSGALRLQYQSGLSPAANGSVTLAGSYDAYGQTLDLERGELLFAGPLNDPAIDVLAVRRIGSTVAGIRLSGTLLAPVPSLYSEPQMSEANALSYLMFGRPLSSSDNSETATLQSTALALGLQQALPVVQRVGETLGLDELSIEPTEVDAGALMAGKYLSPKVYMSYSYGLFNRLGGFLLRYQFNDRLSLETRSGDEKSMDLLYSIEKN